MLSFLPAHAWADGLRLRLAPDLPLLHTSTNMLTVLVQWQIKPGLVTTLKILGLGGTTVRQFSIIQAGTYLIPATALDSLQNDPDVKYVSVDRSLQHRLDYSGGAINAGAARNAGVMGTGVGVAVIDSGMNSDDNLANVPLTLDFTSSSGKAGADQFGHGQHVAGIIASTSTTTAANKGIFTHNFYGIAPGARLINLRVLDANGQGSDTSVIAAIETAVLLKNIYNIRVINLSLGRPVYESYTLDPLCQAVEAAWKAGIVVVVAAGNDGRDNSFGNSGYGTINAPGNDPYVITVGAMKTMTTYDRTDDLLASYSSKGPSQVDHIVKPDIVAPGNLVVSLQAQNSTLVTQNPQNAVLVSYYQNGQDPSKISKNFFTLSGTSMAAPVVSGAVADLLQINPALTPDQIKILLMQTAYKTFPDSSSVTDGGVTYTSYYDIFSVGAGYLDLGSAIANIGNVTLGGSAMSPVANYDANSGAVTLSYDPSSVYANRAVWGRQSVWGAQAVWSATVLDSSNSAVWGTRAVWGRTTTDAQSSVWGSRAVWSKSATMAQSTAVTLNGEK